MSIGRNIGIVAGVGSMAALGTVLGRAASGGGEMRSSNISGSDVAKVGGATALGMGVGALAGHMGGVWAFNRDLIGANFAREAPVLGAVFLGVELLSAVAASSASTPG